MSRLITMGAVLMLAACPLGTAHSQTQTSTVPNVRSMEVLYQLDDRSGSRPDGQLRELLAFHEGSGIGGGIYRWDKNIDKRNHNGGTVIDPSQDYQQNIDNVSVVGNQQDGVWTRVADEEGGTITELRDRDFVRAEWFGALGNDNIDDYVAIQRALISTRRANVKDGQQVWLGNDDVSLSEETFLLSNRLLLNADDQLIGACQWTEATKSLTVITTIAPHADATGLNSLIDIANGSKGAIVQGLRLVMNRDNFRVVKESSGVDSNRSGAVVRLIGSDTSIGIVNAQVNNCEIEGIDPPEGIDTHCGIQITGGNSTGIRIYGNQISNLSKGCLLYTSDAADNREV